ncbi:MAG: VTT domain-containing protein [Gemmatimonadales bacterium]|nr:VTT domain-containing protein [Gemmatimonadales bacterium]
MLAALGFAENIVPVVPADLAAALGAFLARRGTTTPLGVFLVVWLANVAGAVTVYGVARRLGRPFLATALGRRLLSPDAVARIERGYLHYGIAGIFLSRFLPGIRAVVPPFAGIFGLGAWRAVPPLVLASAVWYGGITALGFLLAGEWSTIVSLLGQLSRILAAVAAIVVLAVVGVLLWRRPTSEASLLAEVRRLLGREDVEEGAPIQPRDAARLVLEVAYAEEGLTEAQRTAVAEHLRARWQLEPSSAPPAPSAPGRLARVGRSLGGFSTGRRLALVEEMWLASFAEGRLAGEEPWVMSRAGDLLGLAPAEVERLRARLRDAPG